MIPRIVRESMPVSKNSPRPRVEIIKRVMADMMEKGYGHYFEENVKGFIKKYPLQEEKLTEVRISAAEYKEKCMENNGRVSKRQRELFEEECQELGQYRNALNTPA